jgi:hypothetical protein
MIKYLALLLLCGTVMAQDPVWEPLYSYNSADDCFSGLLEWPQEMYNDGNNVMQLKYYNFTTGYKVAEHGEEDVIFTNTETGVYTYNIDTQLLAWDVGACGLGLWTYQLRYGEAIGGTTIWNDWNEYVVIWIKEIDPSEQPESPYMLAIMKQDWRYIPQNRRDF